MILIEDGRVIPIEERRVIPDEPTSVTVEDRDPSGVVLGTHELPLKEVRDGFAFTEDQDPYCLEDGARYCYKDGGVFLSEASLALCKKLAERIPKRTP